LLQSLIIIFLRKRCIRTTLWYWYSRTRRSCLKIKKILCIFYNFINQQNGGIIPKGNQRL